MDLVSIQKKHPAPWRAEIYDDCGEVIDANGRNIVIGTWCDDPWVDSEVAELIVALANEAFTKAKTESTENTEGN